MAKRNVSAVEEFEVFFVFCPGLLRHLRIQVSSSRYIRDADINDITIIVGVRR